MLHPLGLDELAEAVAREHLDFVITNLGQSVSLARQYPLAWLATLKSPAGDNLAIGAALVVPAQTSTNTGVTSRGKRSLPFRRTPSAATSPFASRQANRGQAGALLLHRAVHRLSAGPAHRAAGGREVAAAIVPVCQLERMEREGKVARGVSGAGRSGAGRLWLPELDPALPQLVLRQDRAGLPALALAVTRALYDLPG